MKKAFLFDMDGVIVDSEKTWEIYGADFSKNLYGEKIFAALGDTTGTSLDYAYGVAKAHGFTMPLPEFYKLYDEQAKKMYAKAHITPGLHQLVEHVKGTGFITGIVSSSRRTWIEIVLSMIEKGDSLFDYTISLNERGLPSKPNPAGYKQAMKDLDVLPSNTIILEDSNSGIKAAKDSGAFVIGFTPVLIDGYVQTEKADVTANSFEEVWEEVKKRLEEIPRIARDDKIF